MAHRVSLVVALAATLIGMASRLRRDQTPVRSAPIKLETDRDGGAAVMATEVVEGIVDVIPAPADAQLVAKPSFVYKATSKRLYGNSRSEILIVGSDHAARYGSVKWLPQDIPSLMAWFAKSLPQDKPVTCFVENANFEWTLNVFSKMQELVKLAQIIKNQDQSPESHAAKMDWIRKFNHKNHIAGVPFNEELTSANFSTLHKIFEREYEVFEPTATGVEVTLYKLLRQFSVASKGRVSVEFIENITVVNEYIDKQVATVGPDALATMLNDVQNELSQLRPAYVLGDAYTYFQVLPLLLSKINGVLSIPERNRKWARTIHDSMQIAQGNHAVVVVGAEHLGRAEEKTPESILDAFESLGYYIVPVDMYKHKRKHVE